MEGCNADPLASSIYFCHTNTDPGTSTNYQQYSCGAFGSSLAVNSKGGQDRIRYRKSISIASLVGAVDVTTDDSFRAIVSAVPTDLVYFGIGIGTISGGNFTVGIAFQGFIEMSIEFYGRKNTLAS
jgi:hypothetical protein